MLLRRLWLASLTSRQATAGTNSSIVLIVNSNGEDVLHKTFGDTGQTDLERGVANLYSVSFDEIREIAGASYGRIDPEKLSPGSVRVGIRGADRWKPERLFVWGQDDGGSIIPIALHEGPISDMGGSDTGFLSTDPRDETLAPNLVGSRLSTPLAPLQSGNEATKLTHIDLILLTRGFRYAGTDSRVSLRITGDDGLLLNPHLPSTPQADLEKGEANWYRFDLDPHRQPAGIASINLEIEGDDMWAPHSAFVFGFGGGPVCVPLAYRSVSSRLSRDPSEGDRELNLL